MNRAERRHPTAAPAPFHVHAEPHGGPGGTVSIQATSARILLDILRLPQVGALMVSGQNKLQCGMVQQELENQLATLAPRPAGPTDVDEPESKAADAE